MVKWVYSLVFGLLALATQAHAVYTYMLWQPAGALDPLLSFFVWQAIVALANALLGVTALPQHDRRSRRGAFLHIFALCLFLPVAGPVLFFSLILVARMFPAPLDSVKVRSVEAPQFTHLISRLTCDTGARLRVRVENLRSSPADRIAALAALQSLPSRITGGLLRDLLSDPVEEIRLLAYGIVDGTEKSIMQKIVVAREQLERVVDAHARGNANGRLAELYWELIYQNLVRGAVYRYTLSQVEHFARRALSQNQRNASMWYLLGRCASLNDAPQRAEQCFQRAQALHFPADQLLPRLAEVAFLKRDYSRIGPLLDSLGKGAMVPVLQPVVRYWSK
jgi:polysaccharide biosynthesis protein PelE